jgi:hypothetical protein
MAGRWRRTASWRHEHRRGGASGWRVGDEPSPSADAREHGGVICLASLATPRPLMFHFALESNGGIESRRGKEFADRWRYAAFRRVFVVMTVVWGAAFVVQAAVSAAIIEATFTEKAILINKILPYLFLGVLGGWTVGYGMRA